MFQLLLILMIFLMISMLMLFLNFLISKKMTLNREKISPFECGFDPSSTSRLPFSTQFFMISIIFLIFDIEIALLMPVIQMTCYMSIKMIYTSLIFLLILMYGLYMEYLEQSMDWKM
uniref:NADH dehydrogenase subunit 3 n=1 Tax=Stenamma megamanni TaxID=1504014 RepID=UPI001FCD629A|nr:NADH dehydrogenase subunit 3 [Stenamma megamanni]UNZ99572.1 NADH dehydrogenase subunit 3 [Stenamma megamanni]